MASGTFGVNPNGVGLGDSKTFFQGFSDGPYTMTYDGIPFEDTNTPTHHSWAFILGQWIGGANFDRSPGSAATIGPTNFGGSINLLSRPVRPSPDTRASISYGSFNIALYDLNVDSGQFGKSNFTLDIHQMKSNGYQTYNYQKRDAGFLKYQYQLNSKTVVTIFDGVQFVTHDAPYHSWLPSIDARYLLRGNWSVYAQFAEGSVIAPSSVFDTKNASVAVLPKPTVAKTYQTGSVSSGTASLWMPMHTTRISRIPTRRRPISTASRSIIRPVRRTSKESKRRPTFMSLTASMCT